jgi:hypothetical protein
MKQLPSMIKSLAIATVILVMVVFGIIFSGVYPMGADTPHNKLSFWMLETLRERSIERSAADIEVPDLSSSDLLLAGGPDYNEMCAACHLKPGIEQTDLSVGLYPSPPNLSKLHTDSQHAHPAANESAIARRNFWIVKHGIKASGMPAWGPTHDDQRIWAMVAFLQKLPELSPAAYQILTARDPSQAPHH